MLLMELLYKTLGTRMLGIEGRPQKHPRSGKKQYTVWSPLEVDTRGKSGKVG